MIILDCVQGEDIWFAARAGIPTSSNFGKIMYRNEKPSEDRAKVDFRELHGLKRIVGDDKVAFEAYFVQWAAQNKYIRSESADKYMKRLAGERITGKIDKRSFRSLSMDDGKEIEEEARNFYSMSCGQEVKTVGFCYKDEEKRLGGSPDFLVGEDGIGEIKCPEIETHVESLLRGTVPSVYYQQCQGNLMVTGRKWCDFVSYYEGLRPLIVRIPRDEEFIKALELHISKFNLNLDQMVEKIK